MNYEFRYQEGFLIIKLSGTVGANERLMTKQFLLQSLRRSYKKIIVDLAGLRGGEAVYCVGVLNTIKKEVQLMSGEMKLCSLTPGVSRYFQENRLDLMFDIKPSIEHAKVSFLEERND
jgi:anti-anti-sigma factor